MTNHDPRRNVPPNSQPVVAHRTKAEIARRKKYFHKDMTTSNIVIAVLTVLANITVIITLFNTTSFSTISTTSFLLVNILCLILLLVLNFVVMLGIRTKKKSTYGLGIAMMCVFLVIGSLGTYYLLSINSSLGKMTSTTTQENVATSLVVYDASGTQTINEINELEGKIVGFATGTQTGQLGQQEISANGLNVTYTEFQDYASEMLSLLNGEIDCAVLPSNYESMFANETGLAEYMANTASILDFEHSVTVDNAASTTNKDLTTEPFTVLLIGNADGLSDTIMVVSVNPISMEITMSSIARDSYVPITCYNNGQNKINSARSVSRDCLIATVEQLTGITIDYYVDTNFQGVVDVVDALGGIVVNSPLEFVGQTASSTRGTKTVWVPAGDNVVLNGEQALAFARERYAFASGDFARQAHQQEVIKSMIRSIMRTRDLNTFVKVFQAAGENVQTNLSLEQMSGFVSYAMQKINRYYDQEHVENVFNIRGSRITGYSSGLWDESLGISLYIYRLYEGSIADTRAAVQRNVDMTSAITAPTSTKWSVNWDFTVPGISAETYNEAVIESSVPTTIGNYVGRSLSALQSWANAFGITVNAAPVQDQTQANGVILTQDVPAGTNVGDITVINVTYVDNGTTATPSPTPVGANCTEGQNPSVDGCVCTLGYTWSNGTCHSTAEVATPTATTPPAPVACTEGQDPSIVGCVCNLGFTWTDNTCHSSAEPTTPPPAPACTEGQDPSIVGCVCNLGFTWTDNTCHSTAETTPTP